MGPPGGGRRDPVEVCRPRGAVDQRDPVEQERGGEGAEDEILHRRLGRGKLALEESGEHVQRERHQLERQEQDNEIAGGGEQHHAAGREEDEGVVLARLGPVPSKVVDREHHDERRRVADHHVGEEREVVEHEHVLERAPGLPPAREHHEERAHQAGEGDGGDELAPDRPRQEVEQEHEPGGAEHDQHRREGTDRHRRHREGRHGNGVREAAALGGWPDSEAPRPRSARETRGAALFDCTWAISASSVASVLPVNVVG